MSNANATTAAVPRFDEHHEEIHERIATVPGLVFCTDFDGTLAPIETDPDAPEITPENRRILEELRDHDRIRVAVVSGRALDDVRERVGIEGIAYAGNHGLELHRNGSTTVHPVAAKRRERLQRIREHLEDRLEPIEGTAIEDKAVTLTIHFRRTPDEEVPAVREAVQDTVSRFGDDRIECTDGKQILELRPAVRWHKGMAVSLLAASQPDDWLPIYIGDDTTDESAFRAVMPDGIAIHVGHDETDASYQVPSQSDVADCLANLRRWFDEPTDDHTDTRTRDHESLSTRST